MFDKLAQIRKAIVSLVGVALTILTFVTDNFGGILPASWTAIVAAVIGALTVVSTWATPNKPAEVKP